MNDERAIAALFQTQPLLGVQASKATVMQRMPQARLIHLATHGSFNNARRLGSAIALTPSGKDDGWLTLKKFWR